MSIRIALPKGRLLKETAKLTTLAGWELSDYSEEARLYHLNSGRYTDLSGKIFHEKDIPIQVAMGNYDLGICGLDWIQELVLKYPSSGLVKLKDLGYGGLSLFLATSQAASELADLKAIQNSAKVISIATEYPNLAESLALNYRFKRFNVFPLWGAAEIYPPENADLVLLSEKTKQEMYSGKLVTVTKILDSSAYLIANKTSLETKDLSQILDTIYVNLNPNTDIPTADHKDEYFSRNIPFSIMPDNSVRLALPDGHAQKHVINILGKAGINTIDYPSNTGNRRPEIAIPGFSAKVIRPQDMPLQVANNKFDVAITGQDWVREHLFQFPSSPIKELVDLKYSKVKIVAAIHNNVPANNIAEFRQWALETGMRIRIASEYVRIADKYARDNHLGMYRIIPTWGATEAFIPDDADMLIENTETGGTLKRHNLKIIEILFESTACLIAGKAALDSIKKEKIESLAESLAKAVA